MSLLRLRQLDFFGDKQREDEANKASNASKKSKRRRIERRGTGSAAAEDEEAAPTRTVEEARLTKCHCHVLRSRCHDVCI